MSCGMADPGCLCRRAATVDYAELIGIHPRDARPEELRRQRESAGLTVAMAAALLQVGVRGLEGFEAGTLRLPAAVAARMARVYGCGDVG